MFSPYIGDGVNSTNAMVGELFFVYLAFWLIIFGGSSIYYLHYRERARARRFKATGERETLWPKPKKTKRPWRKPKPWGVWYVLTYDGGSTEWRGYYRTEIQARIASWWNCHISSWGGTAVLYYQGTSD